LILKGIFSEIRNNYYITQEPLVLYLVAKDPAGKFAQDSISINVDPSTLYIIELLVYILGPILSIIGLVVYKYLIFNIFFKNKY